MARRGITRRTFLKRGSAGVAALGIGLEGCGPKAACEVVDPDDIQHGPFAREVGQPVLMAQLRSARPFLQAFAEASLGLPEDDHTTGPLVVDRLLEFAATVPVSVLGSLVAVAYLAPVYAPERLWFTPSAPLADRKRLLEKRHRDFIDAPIDPLADGAVLLWTLKSTLAMCYLELDSTWAALGYQPDRPFPLDPATGKQVSPPSGPGIHPPRSAGAALLHARAGHLDEVPEPFRSAAKTPGRTRYCVIGSGAGGAAAAHAILEKSNGRADVILLESGGLHTHESMPVRMLDAASRLYMNAGITLSNDRRMAFRQGRCVGGSTTVNNAVCLKPEGVWFDILRQHWSGAGAELDWPALLTAYDELAVPDLLNVHSLEQHTLSPGARRLAQGFAAWPAAQRFVAPVNVKDCVGCGRCNIGCRFDAKRSPLVSLIPRAVEMGALLVPDAHVQRLVFDRKGRVGHVEARTACGDAARVYADRFIVAAGPLASTRLLLRSDPMISPALGKSFRCNFGSPVFGLFPEAVRSDEGQQIGFVFGLPEERLAIETAFGPPGMVGAVAPQWCDDFARLVKSYKRMAAASLTVASIQKGTVTLDGIDFALHPDDWRRLAVGMKHIGQAMFDAGAAEVMDSRFSAATVTRKADLDGYYDRLGPRTYLKVDSGHLVGGNVIHEWADQGVVDKDLKVHGMENLWVCDASVIPAPITLNIQYTVMALARFAAKRMV